MKRYWSQWYQFTNLFAVFLLSSGTMDQLTEIAVSVISRRPCTSGQDFHNKTARTGDDVYNAKQSFTEIIELKETA